MKIRIVKMEEIGTTQKKGGRREMTKTDDDSAIRRIWYRTQRREKKGI